MTYPTATLSLLPLSGAALLLASCATVTPPELAGAEVPIALGRNEAREPCTASRTYSDRTIVNKQDASWSITCRNVLASRSLGYVRRVANRAEETKAIEATLNCGRPSAVAVKGLKNVVARRCFDAALGSEAVALAFTRNGQRYVGTATPGLAGTLEEALRLISQRATAAADGDRIAARSFDPDKLAPAPVTAQQAGMSADLDARVQLEQGILLNRKGQHVEASRVLNDVISRLPTSSNPTLRAELSLEAALADSNIGFTQPSTEHFARADAIIANEQVSDKPLLQRKREIYRALDALNRRNYRTALRSLEQLTSGPVRSGQPLRDLAVLGMLNQPRTQSSDFSGLLSSPDDNAIAQLMLDTQANWARSVAMRATSDLTGAEGALAEAERTFAPLRSERFAQPPMLWLSARLERQRARLAADRKDWDAAIRSYDKSIDDLRQSSIGSAGTGNEPAVVEAQLERATVLARRGGSPAEVRGEFDTAIDALIASRFTGTTVPSGVDSYLELLIEQAKAGSSDEIHERYFRAMQAVGEPAVGRQISLLQDVATANPEIGAKVRDRADLERDVTRLRYQIAAAEPARAAELERQRQAAETKLLALSAELQNSNVEETPSTVAEVRAALRPAEMFLKVSEINRKLYGIAITKEETFIYPIQPASRYLRAIATELRKSIDGGLEPGERKLVPFNVQASYSLFNAIAGPARARLLQSQALVIDPAGPLERIPAGVLVTDQASVDRYKARRRKDAFNYSDLSFLAARTNISTAVSPRSFLKLRALPASAAPNPFIGFAEHVPPTTGVDAGPNARIEVGDACSVEFTALREMAREAKPIARKEVDIAAAALGMPNAPVVAGEAFSDTALKSRNDLTQYKVLHFATHGLQEGQWGCDRSPPALVTSFGDRNSDGLLSFAEIAELDLNANLVVLSACDTGAGIRSQALARQSGQEEAGATLEGLVRAFLAANSRAVLATHWQVSAEAETDELIRTFYATALNQDIGGSLQAAQRKLLANPRYSHPFYWGAYFVVGDSSKMMLSGGARADAGSPAPAARGR